MARTDTEVYRRFEGELQHHPLRFLPLLTAGLRVATKRKIPLLLLLAPPAIATIVNSVIVYGKFLLESQSPSLLDDPQAAVAVAMAGTLIEVRDQIFGFNQGMQAFSLLAMTWYGAGLIAEDQRVGAHQLYFSRPLTRLDYFLGKFGIAAAFGALTMAVPGLVICTVAAFSSPEWSFLKEEWTVICGTLAYAALWIAFFTSLVLAVSSLVKRKTYALVGVFALTTFSQVASGVLTDVQDEPRFRMVGVIENFLRVGEWIFDPRSAQRDWDLWISLALIGGTMVLCWLVTAWRLRRLEVVG